MYRYFQILSFDVVLGACFGSAMISYLLNVELSSFLYVLLGLSVWIIYTSDRLLDVKKLQSNAISERHFFHQKHYRLLVTLVGISVAVCIYLLLFIPKSTLIYGVALCAIVGFYFFLVQFKSSRRSYSKELIAALIYVAGIFLPAVSLRLELDWIIFIVFFQYLLLALVNLFQFSIFEVEHDRKESFNSLSTEIGPEKVWQYAYILLAVNTAISIILLLFFRGNSHLEYVELVFALMLLMQWLITVRRGTFTKNGRYRLWGDLIFLFPGLILLI